MYKVGQKVRVVDNSRTGHQFEIGEVVTVRTVTEEGDIDSCSGDDGDYWWVSDAEITPIIE